MKINFVITEIIKVGEIIKFIITNNDNDDDISIYGIIGFG